MKIGKICVIATLLLSASVFAVVKVPPNPYKNPKQAFNYVYNVSVKQNSGDSWANYLLGKYYEEGYGCAKDVSQAYVWYKMSSTNKYQPAIDALAKLKLTMTKQQIASAQKTYETTRNKSVAKLLTELKNVNK